MSEVLVDTQARSPHGQAHHSPTRVRWRVVLHDYGGYAFPVQLARWLAARDCEVLYLYSADIVGPRGGLSRRPDDSPRLVIEPLALGQPLARYDLPRRLWQELRYGRRLARRIASFRPDIVLSTNTPPTIQGVALTAAHRSAAVFVNWVQDLFSLGSAAALRQRLPGPLAGLAQKGLAAAEFGAMRSADAVIVIAPEFASALVTAGVRRPVPYLIENWAPLDDIRPGAKANPWARRHGLEDRFVFLSAGTLGMKHDPALLADLARGFRDDPAVRVVVASQGPGRDALEAVRARESLDGLILLDYQPYDALPDMLATADVATAVLRPFASAMSVPSKVYAYLGAARPVLGAIPPDNLMHRLINHNGVGLCVDPRDRVGFVQAAHRLRQDDRLRHDCAARAAAYVRTAFDIDTIGNRFTGIFTSLRPV